MKKTTLIIALLAVFFTHAYAAAAAKTPQATAVPTPVSTPDKPVDRLDMSLYGNGGFTVLGQVQTGGADVAKAGDVAKPGAGKKAAAAAEVLPVTPNAMGFTFDLMSIARTSFDPFDLDLLFSLVFGDYGIFGMEAIYLIQFVGNGDYFGGTVGLDLGFEFFPLGNSPSGLYIGPMLGAKMYMLDGNYTSSDIMFSLDCGAIAGYRWNLNGFILETGLMYSAEFGLSDAVSGMVQNFMFKVNIGGFTEQVTPEMAEANRKKSEGNKK